MRRTSKFALLALLIGTSALVGCAQRPITAELHRFCFKSLKISSCATAPGVVPEDDKAIRMLSAVNDAGRLVIVRHMWPDLQGVSNLLVNEKSVQRMIPASVIAVDVQPGRHVVRADPMDEDGSLTVDIQAGQVVTLELRKTSWSPRRFVVREIKPEIAQTLMRGADILGVFRVPPPANFLERSPTVIEAPQLSVKPR
jgi:hypothetical protein